LLIRSYYFNKFKKREFIFSDKASSRDLVLRSPWHSKFAIARSQLQANTRGQVFVRYAVHNATVILAITRPGLNYFN